MTEPEWLTHARQLQAIAQTGLAFSRDPYDRERYEQLRAIASDLMARRTPTDAPALQALFGAEGGYATPKSDVRGAVFDDEGRLLLVREVADHDRWTLPGGWADVNLSAAQNCVKEVREESGYDVGVTKLAAVWDRSTQGHTPGVFSCYKLFFICRLEGGAGATSLETSGFGWFAEHELPADLSLDRVLPQQLHRMFAHWRAPSLPTDVD